MLEKYICKMFVLYKIYIIKIQHNDSKNNVIK